MPPEEQSKPWQHLVLTLRSYVNQLSDFAVLAVAVLASTVVWADQASAEDQRNWQCIVTIPCTAEVESEGMAAQWKEPEPEHLPLPFPEPLTGKHIASTAATAATDRQ